MKPEKKVYFPSWLIASAMTLLLLSPLFFIKFTHKFNDTPQTDEAIDLFVVPDFDQFDEYVKKYGDININEDNPKIQTLRNLQAWLMLKSPLAMYGAMSPYGFQAYTIALPSWTINAFTDGTTSIPEITDTNLAGSLQLQNNSNFRKLIPIQWNPYIEIVTPKLPPIKSNASLQWTDCAGRKLQNPPAIDMQQAQKALNGSTPIKATAIEIIPGRNGALHRLIIRQSCGNTTLDSLAIDALRTYIYKQRVESCSSSDNQLFPVTQLLLHWNL